MAEKQGPDGPTPGGGPIGSRFPLVRRGAGAGETPPDWGGAGAPGANVCSILDWRATDVKRAIEKSSVAKVVAVDVATVLYSQTALKGRQREV